jgi:predicted RND superfamily exporter protein
VTLVVLCSASGAGLSRLSVDSDLLCALPAGDPAVRLLRGLESRFGILSMALVGVTADDLFSASALEGLRGITRGIARVPGVAHAQSVTEVLDVESTAEGSTVAPLIRDIPKSATALAALRHRVLTREGVAGNLVSARGDAALVVVQLQPGADAPKVVTDLRRVAEAHAGPLTLHFTGAPVVADFVAREAPRRIAVFVPGAILAVLIVLLAMSGGGPRRARHLWFPVVSGAATILWTAGAVGAFGTALCGSTGLAFALPFVLGLTAGALVARRGVAEGAPIIAVGAVITAAALCALGAFPETRLSAFIGAGGSVLAGVAAVLLGVAARFTGNGEAHDAVVPAPPTSWSAARWRPVFFGGVSAVFALAGVAGLTRLEAPASGSAAFGEGDEPRVAERFLGSHFAFGDTMFVEVAGDLTRPEILLAVETLEESLHAVPGVTTVQAITIPLRLTHQSLTGRRELPKDVRALGQLWSMLEGNKDIASLVDKARARAMLLVQLSPLGGRAAAKRIEETVARFGDVAAIASPADLDARASELSRRLIALAARYRGSAPADQAARTKRMLAEITPQRFSAAVQRAVDEYFAGDESLVPLRAEGEARERSTERARGLAAELTRIAISGAPSNEAHLALTRHLPEAVLRGERDLVAKTAGLVLERARSALLDAIARDLGPAVDPGARPTADAPRATRYDAELRGILNGALDRSVVSILPARSAPRAAPRLRAAVTGPSLAVLSADQAHRRSVGIGALAALVAALLLTLIVRRSLAGAGAALPGFVAGMTVIGALGIAGIPTDPTVVALVTLALGAGMFAGVLALPAGEAARDATAKHTAAPLLAGAALLAALLMSGFVPLQRFGGVAALALVAAAAGAAWLATLGARKR